MEDGYTVCRLNAMTSVFRDPDVEPTTESIRAALGRAADTWDELTALIADSGALLAWRYYRDGGCVARASNGQKTIAWLNVAQATQGSPSTSQSGTGRPSPTTLPSPMSCATRSQLSP